MKRQRRRRTTVLSTSAAALLATAAPLLTGCSTDAHPGAAAVVGGERISVAEVQDHVEQVRDAQRARPEADELMEGTGGLTRETVNFLIYLEIVERAADEHGVSVSRREVQQARAEAEDYAGGAEALATSALLPQQGAMPLVADQIDAVLRSNLLVQGVAERVGDDQIPAVLATTAEDIGVEVNPRYGQWDAQAVSLVDPAMPWLRQA